MIGIEGLVLTCVLAITNPTGEIVVCVKPDGNVELTGDIDKQSQEFWNLLGRSYLKEYCLPPATGKP